MKIVKILGTGCPNRQSTEKIVVAAVEETKIEATIVKVTDIQEIMNYDILRTPAIVIDEKVVFKGKVQTKAEVKAFL